MIYDQGDEWCPSNSPHGWIYGWIYEWMDEWMYVWIDTAGGGRRAIDDSGGGIDHFEDQLVLTTRRHPTASSVSATSLFRATSSTTETPC